MNAVGRNALKWSVVIRHRTLLVEALVDYGVCILQKWNVSASNAAKTSRLVRRFFTTAPDKANGLTKEE